MALAPTPALSVDYLVLLLMDGVVPGRKKSSKVLTSKQIELQEALLYCIQPLFLPFSHKLRIFLHPPMAHTLTLPAQYSIHMCDVCVRGRACGKR